MSEPTKPVPAKPPPRAEDAPARAPAREEIMAANPGKLPLVEELLARIEKYETHQIALEGQLQTGRDKFNEMVAHQTLLDKKLDEFGKSIEEVGEKMRGLLEQEVARVTASAKQPAPSVAGSSAPQAPSLCRLVIFTFQGKPIPAVINRLYRQGENELSTTVELYILWPQEFSALSAQRTSITFSEEPQEECWSWPKR